MSRGKAAHVDSVVVDGRVLMRGRKLLHLDRDALMQEVAGAAAAAIARRSTVEGARIAELARRISEHYQAPVWHPESYPHDPAQRALGQALQSCARMR